MASTQTPRQVGRFCARLLLAFTSVLPQFLPQLPRFGLAFPSIAPQRVLALTSFLPHFPRVCPTLALFFGLIWTHFRLKNGSLSSVGREAERAGATHHICVFIARRDRTGLQRCRGGCALPWPLALSLVFRSPLWSSFSERGTSFRFWLLARLAARWFWLLRSLFRVTLSVDQTNG